MDYSVLAQIWEISGNFIYICIFVYLYSVLMSLCIWEKLTLQEQTGIDKVLHLLPTCAAFEEVNFYHLAAVGKPVLHCKIQHNHSEAKKASDDDADGPEKEILITESAKVMLTCNLWTAKGNLNI